jgi:hypothetical protein
MHTIRILVAMAAASLAARTFADDFSPPSWRGQSLTTAQEWEFQNGANPTFPDGNSVPEIYGNGMGGQLPYASFNNMSWETGDGDGQWFPNSSAGQIFFNIPDWIDLEPIKYVYIQIAWDGPQPPIILGVSGLDNLAGGVDGAQLAPPIHGTQGSVFQWYIQPNPDWDFIEVFVPADAKIDQAIVDTISFPEPGAISLIAIGAIVVLNTRAHKTYISPPRPPR